MVGWLANSPKVIVAELGLEPRPPGCRSTSSPTMTNNHFWGACALLLETGAWSLMLWAIPCRGPLTDC